MRTSLYNLEISTLFALSALIFLIPSSIPAPAGQE